MAHYALTAKLYQFYFEMMIKTITASYAITGAILSFCLSRKQGDFSRWALILPLLMSAFFTFMFAFTSLLARKIRADAISMSKTLGLAHRDFSPLVYALAAFSCLYFICATGIAWLLLSKFI